MWSNFCQFCVWFLQLRNIGAWEGVGGMWTAGSSSVQISRVEHVNKDQFNLRCSRSVFLVETQIKSHDVTIETKVFLSLCCVYSLWQSAFALLLPNCPPPTVSMSSRAAWRASPISHRLIWLMRSAARCEASALLPLLPRERLNKLGARRCFPARTESDRTKKNVNMHYLQQQGYSSFLQD